MEDLRLTTLFDESKDPENLIKALSIPMALWNSPRKKVNNETGSRTCLINDIVDKIQEASKKLGMTSLADITGLDTLGLPVYSATCPQTGEGLNTVFSGTGFSHAKASISAMMELIERVSASFHGKKMIYGTYENLNHLLGDQVLNPRQLILHQRPTPIEIVPLAWTWVFNLGSNIPMIVPATAVFHPFYDESGPLFFNNSCGLSAGSNLLEAVISGIYEVIEKDAVSLALVSNIFTSVPIETIDSPLCNRLIVDLQRENIHISIKEITTNIGVPCFVSCGDDQNMVNSYYLNGGFGCHANRDIALTRSIMELIQTRATIISGAREDISDMRDGNGSDYKKIKQTNHRWFSDVDPIQSYISLPTYKMDNLWDELKWLVNSIKAAGLLGPLVANLTQPEVEIPVVRVLIPGLEYCYQDTHRIGPRLIEALRIGQKLGVINNEEW